MSPYKTNEINYKLNIIIGGNQWISQHGIEMRGHVISHEQHEPRLKKTGAKLVPPER
jgi:hypothetical protein